MIFYLYALKSQIQPNCRGEPLQTEIPGGLVSEARILLVCEVSSATGTDPVRSCQDSVDVVGISWRWEAVGGGLASVTHRPGG